MLIHIIVILFKSLKCIVFIGLFIQKTALHAGGQEFESPNLHHKRPNGISCSVFYFVKVSIV